MNLSLGIVGLPNVGKSTLFNALTQNNVPAENYPFNTIDPNVGVVPVMDPRLDKLAELVRPARVTPAVVEFWDIAGLVKGASKGEGLGNQFLANIRNVSAIVHVVRSFKSDAITHVENSVDPKRDIELINTELILKDLETLQSKKGGVEGRAKSDPKIKPLADMLGRLEEHLSAGGLASTFEYDRGNDEMNELLSSMFFLTAKPVIFLVNSEESKIAENIEVLSPHLPEGAKVVGMDVKLEAEIAALPASERGEYLKELGLEEPAIARLTREAYDLLGLMAFFTAGEKEVRAWTIAKGTRAPQAAGVIHTDFEAKFIKADVVPYSDFIAAGGWSQSREQGLVKLAGKDYVMVDGDVVLFKHGN